MTRHQKSIGGWLLGRCVQRLTIRLLGPPDRTQPLARDMTAIWLEAAEKIFERCLIL